VERMEGERLAIALYMYTWMERIADGGKGIAGWTMSGKT